MRFNSLVTRPIGKISMRILVLLVVLMWTDPSTAQITTNTALPVSKGSGILRVQTKYLRATGDPSDAMNRKLSVLMVPLVAVYGVSAKLAAFGIVPFVDKQFEFNGQSGRTSVSNSGIADAKFFLRYTVLQKDDPGATLRIAPFAGTQIPTGSIDAVDDSGSTFPRQLQTGSGAWSPFIGAVLTRQTFAWQIDASISYRFSGESDGFKFGDEARFDLASKIRVLPRNLGNGLPNFLYINLESNLIWRGRNEVSRFENDSSGGVVWFLDPGIQYVTRRVIIETAVQLPVLQELNGTALESDYIFVLSVRFAY
jgi:hypothetical protein